MFYQDHARIYIEGLGGGGWGVGSDPTPTLSRTLKENFSGSAHEGVYLFFQRPLLHAIEFQQ